MATWQGLSIPRFSAPVFPYLLMHTQEYHASEPFCEFYLTIILLGGFMKLKTVKRAAGSKSEIKKLRREGYIPAVLYVKKKERRSSRHPSE